jgi:hypothetical protein
MQPDEAREEREVGEAISVESQNAPELGLRASDNHLSVDDRKYWRRS